MAKKLIQKDTGIGGLFSTPFKGGNGSKSKKILYGKGVKGGGISYMNGKKTKAYSTWAGMLNRCYSHAYHSKRPTYIGCSVCIEWLFFPAFKNWFDDNYVEGWHLDKDLLINGNREYGPDRCIFVPHQLNSLFIDAGTVNSSYPIGVSFRKSTGKFYAQVKCYGKKKHLGCFDSVDEAHKAYCAAKKENVIRVANEWKDKIPPILYDALITRAKEKTII